MRNLHAFLLPSCGTVSSEAMLATGIPNRCANLYSGCVYATISPSGSDDTSTIQAAWSACPDGDVVSLAAGVFHVTSQIYPNHACTLRGAGPGQQLSTGLNVVGGVSFTGTIASSVLTVSAYTTISSVGQQLSTGQYLVGSGVPTGTTITSRGTGTGQNGTYNLTCPGGCPTISSGESMGITTRTCASGTMIGPYPVNGGYIFGGYLCTDATATQIVIPNEWSEPLAMGAATSVNAYYVLPSDAVQGSYSVTLSSTPSPAINAGDIVFLSEMSQNDPNLFYGPNFAANRANEQWYNSCPGYATDNYSSGGTRLWNNGPYINLCEMLEVASTTNGGKTINFNVPIAYPYHMSAAGCSACAAQLVTFGSQPFHGQAYENLMVFGGGGNFFVQACAYCWIKNIDFMWTDGGNLWFQKWDYRSVVRDSFLHEGPKAEPGGNGYLMLISQGGSYNLIENNIMWSANKVDVMQDAGVANVLAYNYTDDGFGDDYDDSQEAGINAGHQVGPHMELIEGNYSHSFKGDDFWGSSPYVTAFRNWFTGLRASSPPNTGYPPLNTFYYVNGGCNAYYGDWKWRPAADIQGGTYYNNFVGNVLGLSSSPATIRKRVRRGADQLHGPVGDAIGLEHL